MLNWCTNTMTFITGHLKLYWSLSNKCHSLTTTSSAPTWGCSWFTSRSLTCITNTIPIYRNGLLGSCYWILKWNFHINVNIWSLEHSLLFPHIEKLWKILKNWFIKFKASLLFLALFKKAGISPKWILLISKFLFISSHTIRIINFPFWFIWECFICAVIE